MSEPLDPQPPAGVTLELFEDLETRAPVWSYLVSDWQCAPAQWTPPTGCGARLLGGRWVWVRSRPATGRGLRERARKQC